MNYFYKDGYAIGYMSGEVFIGFCTPIKADILVGD